VASDYGYDLFLRTFDEDGYAEPDLAYIQLKAAAAIRQIRAVKQSLRKPILRGQS